MWPFATRALFEHAVKLLVENDLVRELYTPMNGGSTLQPKPVEKDFSTRGSCGLPTTSTLGTSLNCASTLKTLPRLQADRASREASSPASTPPLPNYFDVLSEEEDSPPEEILERERESPGLHKALAFSRDPKEKAPMYL